MFRAEKRIVNFLSGLFCFETGQHRSSGKMLFPTLPPEQTYIFLA